MTKVAIAITFWAVYTAILAALAWWLGQPSGQSAHKTKKNHRRGRHIRR